MLGLGDLPVFPVGDEKLYYELMSPASKHKLEAFKALYTISLQGQSVILLNGEYSFAAWSSETARNYSRDAAAKGYKSIVVCPPTDNVSLAYFVAVHDLPELIQARARYQPLAYSSGLITPFTPRQTIPVPPVHYISLGDFKARSGWYEGRYTLEKNGGVRAD